MPFDINTAVAVDSTPEATKPTGKFDISTAKAIDSDGGKTAYENFKTPQVQQGKEPTGTTGSWKDEDFLNATMHMANIGSWKLIGKPLGIGYEGGKATPEESKRVDEQYSQLEKNHPIGAVVAGTIPYIATAPLVPEGVLGLAAQFGGLSGLSAIGKARVDDASKPLGGKVLDVAKEAAEGASFAPIWHYSAPLGWLGKAFVRGTGTGSLTAIYGHNITEAFKQGGTIGALSLIFENPMLAKTALGRGVINKVNNESEIKVADPEKASPQELKQSIIPVAEDMSKKVFSKPKIVSATVKLPDGTEIHGTSHEDALNKVGMGKVDVEGKSKFWQDAASKSIDKINQGTVSVKKSTTSNKWTYDIGDGTISPSPFSTKAKTEEYAQSQKNESLKYLKEKFVSDNLKADLRGSGAIQAQEGKDFQAGFTVQNPDGSTKFITREESKQAPYNLKDGRSEDVQGLNQQKFMTPPEEPKVVNPDTLSAMGEEGKMDLALVPGVTETAELLLRSSKELKTTFTPADIGEANVAATSLRENLGIMARNHDQFEAALSKAKKVFDKARNEDNLNFIYKMEEGGKQESPELQKIHDVLRETLDAKRDEIRALGTGKLDKFIENYFPHIWEKPNAAKKLYDMMAGKRPLMGAKSFLKHRTIESTRLGIENGLTPVSYNPIDMTMLKIREMDRYLMGQKTRASLREAGIEKFVRTDEERPSGWVKINDGSSDVMYKNDAGEMVISGSYYTQPDAARIINNYLSPGLRGNYFYDMYRGGGNVMNQFQLGISAFHLGFTSMDATVSKVALGINKIAKGDVIGAGKEFAKAPFAPITNILEGRKLLEAWNGKDKGEVTNLIASYMASGGGRAKMDSFYKTRAIESMRKSFKEGKVLTGVLKVPFAIVDKMSQPIMEYIVPRQKMGVFSDLMRMELEKNPGASHEQLRSIAQRAWNSVDNRMGQLVYDNLFWNRTVKDLSMASVRSLGWNLGTIRELGGGLKDIKDMGKTGLSYRTAYVMALPIVAGLYGAIYQYLHTGLLPGQDSDESKGGTIPKDLYFPRNGNIDNKGNSSRVSLPTYMKDVYHYTTNPVQTVLNKFSPINNTVLEMLANKDFYGTEIRNVDDPVMQQVFDELKFVGGQFEPFSFRNLGRDTGKSISSKVEPFVGITPAPYDINMTKAEKSAYEMFKSNVPAGSRTKEESDASKVRAKLKSEYFASGDKEPLNDAVKEGTITKKEMSEIVKQKGMTSLQRFTEHLSAKQVMTLMDKATDKEKEELEKIVEKKRTNAKRAGSWTQKMEEKYNQMVGSDDVN